MRDGIVRTTALGQGGPVVSRAGLGLMGMSSVYGAADDAESIAAIEAAVPAGAVAGDRYDERQMAALDSER